jgi:hypothetical protein
MLEDDYECSVCMDMIDLKERLRKPLRSSVRSTSNRLRIKV